MTAHEMGLSDFLLARIAETEDWVEHPLFPEVVRVRMLAECEAHRRIVTACSQVAERDADSLDAMVARDACRYTLKALARPHADHPDYDEAWRP